jgi:hypothetical protein
MNICASISPPSQSPKTLPVIAGKKEEKQSKNRYLFQKTVTVQTKKEQIFC